MSDTAQQEAASADTGAGGAAGAGDDGELIGRHRRDEVRFFRAIARTGVDPAAEPEADRVTDQVAAQAASRELAAAIAGLSREHRDVLLLTASGLGYAEIAVALGVPAGTVSSRLVRARRNVRKALGGHNPASSGEEVRG